MRAMCQYHLVAYQLKWEENNSVEENRKIKKRKERGRGKRKGRCAWGEERKSKYEREKK